MRKHSGRKEKNNRSKTQKLPGKTTSKLIPTATLRFKGCTPLPFRRLQHLPHQPTTHESPSRSLDPEPADSILHAVFGPQTIPSGVRDAQLPPTRTELHPRASVVVQNKMLNLWKSPHITERLFDGWQPPALESPSVEHLSS